MKWQLREVMEVLANSRGDHHFPIYKCIKQHVHLKLTPFYMPIISQYTSIKDVFFIGKISILQGRRTLWHISIIFHCTLVHFALDTNASLEDLILLISFLQDIYPTIVFSYCPSWKQKPYILKTIFKKQSKENFNLLFYIDWIGSLQNTISTVSSV